MSSLTFKVSDNAPEVIRNILLSRGWQEIDEDDQYHYHHLWWKIARFRFNDIQYALPWQYFNHFPNANIITRKDTLTRNLKRMKAIYGTIFDYFPTSFNLPNEYTRFVREFSSRRSNHQQRLPQQQQSQQNDLQLTNLWICKPADLSRGRGIFIFKDLTELTYDCSAVVQQYITNPLLISGYKFDLRLYVVVTSFHPLTIYVYRDGLVRFSTDKFNLSCLKNVYSHLTNTSINKHGPSYSKDKDVLGPGCKWTFSQLWNYLHNRNIDTHDIWLKINTIVILTLLTQAPTVPQVANCFELYGFDILIDDNLKPWLLEVNFSPALSFDCQTDLEVKVPLLNDLFDVLGFGEVEKLFKTTNNDPNNTSHDQQDQLLSDDDKPIHLTTGDQSVYAKYDSCDSEDHELVEEVQINDKARRKILRDKKHQHPQSSSIDSHLSSKTSIKQRKPSTKLPHIAPNRRNLTTTQHQNLNKYPTLSNIQDIPTQVINKMTSNRQQRRQTRQQQNQQIRMILDRWRSDTKSINQIGNYVKIFPFNQATVKSCKGDIIDSKTIIRELIKVNKQLLSASLVNSLKQANNQLAGLF